MKSTIYDWQAATRSLIVAFLATIVAAPAIAQVVFEEIVVTAQKREQNIMDVPVSVTAITNADLQASGIKDVFDLQQNVPGLIVGQSQTATTSNFAIRGIGSTSNNFGIESSVGLYVDGVYRSRQSSLINEMVDVETAEVLRGPQGTLFGKNTPAGAILVRSVEPSQDTDAFFEVTGGDLGLVRVTGAANLVLSDSTAVRGTVFSSTRDGYVSDETFGKDVLNDRDRIGFRLQLGYEPSDDFNMRIIADYSEVDEICCVAVSRVDALYSRASVATPLAAVPGSDAALVQFGGTIFTNFPYPQVLIDALGAAPGTIVQGVGFDDFRVAVNDLPRSQNEDSGISVEFNKTFDNALTLTSISAYRAFDTFDSIDGDFTNVDLFARINNAEQSSFSQEFRLAGEFGGGNNFVVGAYYFGQEITSITDTNTAPFFEPYVLATNPALQQIIDGVNAVSAGSGGMLPPAASAFPIGTVANDVIVQDHQGWAAFAQVDWNLNDQFALTLGARFTDEDKDIDGRYTQTAQGPAPDIDAIGLNLFLASQGMPFDFMPLLPVMLPNDGWGSYLFDPLAPRPDVLASLSDDQFTGTAKLSYFPTESTMFYLSYATGFKSGGTNTDRISPVFSPIFGPETSKSIEAGFKGDLGPVRLSVSVYQTDYEDFQANSFTGTGFNLQNAGEVDTSGFEVEALWRPFDTFEVQAFVARSEGDYKSFVGGTCRDTAVFHTGQPDPGGNGNVAAEVCSRTGDPIPYNAEDRAFVALTKDFPFGNNNLFVRGEWSYYSDQFTDGDLDPFTRQDGVNIVNLRVGMYIENWDSDITVWGRNITDERYFHGSFDAPIQLGRMNSYPSEPSTFGVSLRKNFD